jgi:hypothetical protein
MLVQSIQNEEFKSANGTYEISYFDGEKLINVSRTYFKHATDEQLCDAGTFLKFSWATRAVLTKWCEYREIKLPPTWRDGKDLEAREPISNSSFEAKDEEVSRPNRAAKTIGIQKAYETLWPTGLPSGMAPGQRDKKINDWLRANGAAPADRSTIYRALKQT